jgi:hypothetical protein
MYTPTSARSLFEILGLLLKADDTPGIIEFSHAERLRTRYLRQHDLGVRLCARNSSTSPVVS